MPIYDRLHLLSLKHEGHEGQNYPLNGPVLGDTWRPTGYLLNINEKYFAGCGWEKLSRAPRLKKHFSLKQLLSMSTSLVRINQKDSKNIFSFAHEHLHKNCNLIFFSCIFSSEPGLTKDAH